MTVFGCSCCSTTVCHNPDVWWRDDDSAPVARVIGVDDPVTVTPDYARGPDYADSVPATTLTNASISVGGSVDVTIETLGDHDWYRVTLVAGRTYTFHTSVISGSNPDTYLNLRSSTGTIITSDDDGGDGTYSVISYTPTADGTFFIDAGTFNNESTGSFHLSASSTPLIPGDPLASTATSATLGVSNGINGAIETAGDRDWYRISLIAGETYLFRTGSTTPLSGTNPAGALDTTLTLRDASGNQLATNDDAGEYAYSAIRFTATTTGTYYLDVAALSGATGNYNLTAFTAPALTVFTNDQIALQLTDGYWGGSTHHFNVAPGGTLTYNLTAISAAGQTLARAALALWSDVSGIVFSEITTAAQITFADNQTGAFANASYSNGIASSATVNVGTDWLATYGTGINSYAFQTYIHEIGHALGLGHAGNYNGNADYTADALYLNDSWVATVMSYFDQIENTYTAGLGYTKQFTISPMAADGVAIANLYGANTLTRTGNTTYGFNNNSGRSIYDATAFTNVSYTVYDNGGTDTLDYSGFSQTQRIDLNAESFSNIGGRVGNVSIARGTVIENAIGGSGDDTIIGNAANNTITSGAGVDTLSGGGGDDAFIFGGFFTAADRVDGGTGTDQVGLSGGYTGANRLVLGATTLTGVEVLAALPGGSYDIVLNDANTPAGSSFTMFGGNLGVGENLTFDGSAETDASLITYGGLGVETLNGGTAADGFYFGPGKYGASDTVHGNGGSNDQLALDGNYSLVLTSREDVEVFVMLGGPTGTPNSFTITLADSFAPSGQTRTLFALATSTGVTVNGGAEADATLVFFGGTGNDTLTGGAGADSFYGNRGGDTLTGGAGNDTYRYDDVLESFGTGSNRDQILDFRLGDRIDLSRIDAVTGGGDDAFSFLGSAAFSNVAGQLRAVNSGGNIFTVEGDINGDGIADFSVLLTNADAHAITTADFVL